VDQPPQTLDDIDYELSPSQIAQTPLAARDQARLLVDRGTHVEHRHVADLPDLLEPGDLLVVNNTRVLPARLPLRRDTGGAVEVLLLEARDDGTWEALVRPSKKLAPGSVVTAEGLSVEIGEDLGEGRRVVRPDAGGRSLLEVLHEVGLPPLPPYIDEQIADPERYQTVFADRPVSAAAPTAGLHLTDAVFSRLAEKGIEMATVELAVGLDTFRPVQVDNLDDHVMHSEWYSVPTETQEKIAAAQRVVAVGTTSVRALETWGTTGAAEGRSRIFIRRPYDWSVVNVLMTNFHLPRSTLLCLVDAFVGPRWRDLYAEALAENYRFLSFGDAMLLGANADMGTATGSSSASRL
jgi:S-adenosylmethionine:tRNA ribosyltransferase-isomerase